MRHNRDHMKHLVPITLLLLTLVTFGTYHASIQLEQTIHQPSTPIADGIKMQKGTMIVYKNGKASAMTTEMVLSDGSRVMMDGTVVRKSGTKLRLKEGDHIDMNGKITNPSPSKNP
jgi:Mg-chelatase subunit ChlD